MNRLIGGGGTFEFDVKLGGDGAGWNQLVGRFHQVIRGGPVAVAVEQGTTDAAVEHVVERFVVFGGLPVAYDNVAPNDALELQALFVGRAAAETSVLGCVAILKALFGAQRSHPNRY